MPIPTTAVTTWDRIRNKLYVFYRNWGPLYLAREASDIDARAERYDRLWDIAVGNAFTDKKLWSKYRRTHGLYRQTRSVVDYGHIAVEFWASRVWSGTIADDGKTLPDGQINAVPFAKDTKPEVALAAAQLFQWTNFQSQMSQIPRYAAALGELLVEIIDEPDRGKVVWDIIWPGYVKSVDLDESGNVRAYTLEYNVADAEFPGKSYRYRKEVDKEEIRTFKDNEPFSFDGIPSVIDNPYGFCPARWFRHFPMLGNRGEPAIYAAHAEMDELSSLLSHLLDKVHVNLESPVVVTGNLAPGSVTRLAQMQKRVVTEELSDPDGGKQDWNVLEAPAGTEIKTVTVATAETIALGEKIEKSIERKLPEVAYVMQMREMTQVTGPVTSRLGGDVDFRFKSVCSGHDRNLGALLEMSIAIAGWRVNNGDWDGTVKERGLSKAQQKFSPFDLESFDDGELSVTIMPRDLVPQTEMDRFNNLIAKKNALKLLDTPTGARMLMIEAGYPEDVADTLGDEYDTIQEEQKQREKQNMNLQIEAKSQSGGGKTTSANQRGAPNKNGRPAAGQGVK